MKYAFMTVSLDLDSPITFMRWYAIVCFDSQRESCAYHSRYTNLFYATQFGAFIIADD